MGDVLILIAVTLAAGAGQAAERSRPTECVKIERSEKLMAGQSFSFGLPGGFRFDLTASDEGAWDIAVVDPKTPDVDYMWVVSPPYQTAPQRMIAASYGQTAAENASFTRQLRFVLTAHDHKTMFDLLAARAPSDRILESVDGLTTGTLALDVTGFETRTFTRENGTSYEGFAWITFVGEACVPR